MRPVTNFLQKIDKSYLHTVIAAHLSQHNNLPEYAHKAIKEIAFMHGITVKVADQNNGVDWINV